MFKLNIKELDKFVEKNMRKTRITLFSFNKMNYYYFVCVENNYSSNFSIMPVQHNTFNRFTLKKH